MKKNLLNATIVVLFGAVLGVSAFKGHVLYEEAKFYTMEIDDEAALELYNQWGDGELSDDFVIEDCTDDKEDISSYYGRYGLDVDYLLDDAVSGPFETLQD